MKKILLLLLSLTVIMFSFSSFVVAYDEDTSVPYKTYTTGPNNQIIFTQTAYQPSGYVSLDASLNRPEDMVFYDDHLYVLNTGNRNILIFDALGNLIDTWTHELLNNPTGIDVYDDTIYIADKGLRAVLLFTLDGTLVARYDRPTEPIFGQNSLYIPTKIEVGPRGNMYVVGEGSTSGVIQLSNQGEFLGFFATNLTGRSWLQTLADTLGVQYALNTPSSATNLKMDLEGSLYTISPTDSKPLKRFNIASIDTLDVSLNVDGLTAVAVSDIGNIVTLSNAGVITEYDALGRLIFSFGGIDDSSQNRLGLMVLPVDIELNNDGDIYVLDKGLNEILVYRPTAFTQAVHQGLESFNNGIYDINVWNQVLQLNEMFAVANQAIGQAHFRENRFEDALEYFALAQYKDGYSDAFWQMRYQFLQQYLGLILMTLLGTYITLNVLKKVDARYSIYDPLRTFKTRVLKVSLLKQLSYVFTMMKRPLDVFYDIKHRHRSSYLAATIIYVIFIIMTLVATLLPSFLFRDTSTVSFSLLRHLGIYVGFVVLLVFSNYLIATLNNGEGWFKDVYIGFAYSLAPFILLTIPVTLSSYGFTLFEQFIYNFLWFIIYGWTVIYFLIMLKEIHGYSIKQIVFNIFLTVVTMLLFVILIFISYLLMSQVFDYILSIIREVSARASN